MTGVCHSCESRGSLRLGSDEFWPIPVPALAILQPRIALPLLFGFLLRVGTIGQLFAEVALDGLPAIGLPAFVLRTDYGCVPPVLRQAFVTGPIPQEEVAGLMP